MLEEVQFNHKESKSLFDKARNSSPFSELSPQEIDQLMGMHEKCCRCILKGEIFDCLRGTEYFVCQSWRKEELLQTMLVSSIGGESFSDFVVRRIFSRHVQRSPHGRREAQAGGAVQARGANLRRALQSMPIAHRRGLARTHVCDRHRQSGADIGVDPRGRQQFYRFTGGLLRLRLSVWLPRVRAGGPGRACPAGLPAAEEAE